MSISNRFFSIEVYHILLDISEVSSMVLTRAGNFCGKSDFGGRMVAKCDVRQSLVYIARFHSGARPSRGSLKQVYNYLLNKQEPKQDVKWLSLP